MLKFSDDVVIKHYASDDDDSVLRNGFQVNNMLLSFFQHNKPCNLVGFSHKYIEFLQGP